MPLSLVPATVYFTAPATVLLDVQVLVVLDAEPALSGQAALEDPPAAQA
jgi:hypothetical protein